MSTVEHGAWPPPPVHRHTPHQHGQSHLQPPRRPLVAAPVPVPPAPASPVAGTETAISTTVASTTATVTAMLLPLRIFLAAGWLRAGIEKSVDHSWWSGGNLRGFLSERHDLALPFFRPVMDHVFEPYAIAVTAVVVVAEIAIGLAIVAGRWMRVALQAGVVLNVVFVLCGQVNPSAFYLVMEIALLFAIADGVLGMRPSPASRRTLLHAGIAAAHGFALVPYINTIEPAKVIADPAMMLVFLSFTISGTLVVRWMMRNATLSSAERTWTARFSDWAHARRLGD